VAPSAEQLAIGYYNRGLEHRDKAWALEEKAVRSRKPDRVLGRAHAEWTRAVVAFREAAGSDPAMQQAHGSLGYAYRKLGRYEDALHAYDRALTIDPGYVEAIEYRGEAYLGLDRLDEAKEAYLDLFRRDRAQAAALLDAMQRWVEARRTGSAGRDGTPAAAVDALSTWVDERAEIAAQTEQSTTAQGRSW
jgi:tetratricopeptide (TPR) repeat protein